MMEMAMTAPKALKIDGKKFMWDGVDYESPEAVKTKLAEYEKEGFEARMVEEEGKAHVYTRRVVTEVQVEGS